MTSRARLSDGDVQARLQALPAWQVQAGRLRRELRFGTFVEAFSYMTALALVAERMDHHPEFRNVYNRVSLELWTHDVGGLTALDFEFAERAERLVSQYATAPQA